MGITFFLITTLSLDLDWGGCFWLPARLCWKMLLRWRKEGSTSIVLMSMYLFRPVLFARPWLACACP